MRTVGTNIEDEDKISINEILRKVRKLKTGKAAGADEIRVEFIKNGGMGGILWLGRILNLALVSGKGQADWRNAIIAPIHKKGNRKECSNYRGISLLSVVGKLYSSILVDRVRGKVENILGEFQGGFRPLRGCQDQYETDDRETFSEE